MISKNKNRIYLILGAAMTALLLFSFVNRNDKLFAIAKNLDIFASLVRELDSYYVDEIDAESLVTVGINAMLEELDPYTEFIPEENSDDFRLMTTGEYGGVGALIGNRTGANMILMPYKGFPAQAGGLRIGDEILKVDTVNVVDKTTADISKLLKGPANTEVFVQVKRGEDTLSVNLTRRKIVISNVPYYGKIDHQTGYIKLSDFTTNAAADVRKALVDLKSQGVTRLVLDVRDNPGGILKEAVEVVNLFIPKGKEVVRTQGKLESVNAVYKTTKSPLDKEIPLVVLINERSASAAEIVAGALQDYDRAVLIGRKTFGKGLVQTTVPLSYNSQVKVTTAKYYIPSGRCIQAIDYSKKDENGNSNSVPDSLRNEFRTKSGRIVLDGAGIEPDLKIDSKSYAPITYSLVARSLIFDFGNEFFRENEEIPAPSEFRIEEDVYQNFIDWLEDKEYDYTTYVEKSLEDLLKYAEKEKYFEEIQPTIKELKKKVSHNKEQDLITYKDEIKSALKEEIISRYYYQEGVIESSLHDDSEIEKSLKVLSDPNEVKSILVASAVSKK
ncbi:C-terminal processing peptidase, tail-specific protease [Indibacter alkaliphilus LW1]|uniref:C-terminal processing peptidase, tail-specific protease n=1 Tax=Indibacter alkaliphilus (strain CCUG 57479 / KCTC 22604 / LW1) TaxID=1189612 RepID=S2DRC4_INDAL|nr:S41 family peptidase [Indibacter alkaliphilus]EOZ92443.1 C-terminal processing peptidase, tail-specific protease [Indibacter alkaliphilus LW1]